MSTRGTVLIVEDDPAMRRGLKDNFEFEGYKVVTAADGDAALKAVMGVRPDLVVLDVMLPKVNGYEVCRFIRQEKLTMPILMLTAKDQESDVILGLKLGADDYVTKPFSIKEVLARAEVLLRRQSRDTGSEAYTFGDCRLDCEARTFTRGGREVPLSPKEFELLRFFASRPGQALSRDLIMNSVWGYDAAVTPRSIDRFVNALRNKIEKDPAKPLHIRTVREFGYKFEPQAV
jgi:DNA-binding response OmpR family regulator